MSCNALNYGIIANLMRFCALILLVKFAMKSCNFMCISLNPLRSAGRNIGLGIFVNGAFALQFSNISQSEAIYAIAEGIIIMLLASFGEMKFKRV